MFADNYANPKNEDFVRIHEDPLYLILKEEKKQRKEIEQNPYKMKMILNDIKKDLRDSRKFSNNFLDDNKSKSNNITLKEDDEYKRSKSLRKQYSDNDSESVTEKYEDKEYEREKERKKEKERDRERRHRHNRHKDSNKYYDYEIDIDKKKYKEDYRDYRDYRDNKEKHEHRHRHRYKSKDKTKNENKKYYY